MGLTMPCPDLPSPLPAFQPIFCSSLFPMLSPPIPDLVGCSYLQNDQLWLSQEFIVLNFIQITLNFLWMSNEKNFWKHTSIKKWFYTLLWLHQILHEDNFYHNLRDRKVWSLVSGFWGRGNPVLVTSLLGSVSILSKKKNPTYNVPIHILKLRNN